MAEPHTKALIASLSSLLNDKTHTDLTIRTSDGKTFEVHKAILCSRSPVLAKTINAEMMEKQTGVIVQELFDAETVGRMLEYVYTSDYGVIGKGDAEKEDVRRGATESQKAGGTMGAPIPNADGGVDEVNERMKAHVRVYAIGDYYDIPTLRLLARDKFTATAGEKWSKAGFAGVIGEVYGLTSTANHDLRDALLCVAIQHVRELVEDRDFMKGLADMEGIQDFMVHLLGSVVKERFSAEDLVRESENEEGFGWGGGFGCLEEIEWEETG